MIAIGILILVRRESILRLIFVIFGLVILADALLRIQMSVEAKKFGLKKTAGSDHHQKGNEGLAGIISRREITSNKILLDTLANQDYTLYEKKL